MLASKKQIFLLIEMATAKSLFLQAASIPEVSSLVSLMVRETEIFQDFPVFLTEIPKTHLSAVSSNVLCHPLPLYSYKTK
ncbi:MAG TPA: hypothetical protein H9858_03710 [Candidatus Blautia stercoravium]|nr:hypothetical protein [Candidatus Blautia stercoravium]